MAYSVGFSPAEWPRCEGGGRPAGAALRRGHGCWDTPAFLGIRSILVGRCDVLSRRFGTGVQPSFCFSIRHPGCCSAPGWFGNAPWAPREEIGAFGRPRVRIYTPSQSHWYLIDLAQEACFSRDFW